MPADIPTPSHNHLHSHPGYTDTTPVDQPSVGEMYTATSTHSETIGKNGIKTLVGFFGLAHQEQIEQIPQAYTPYIPGLICEYAHNMGVFDNDQLETYERALIEVITKNQSWTSAAKKLNKEVSAVTCLNTQMREAFAQHKGKKLDDTLKPGDILATITEKARRAHQEGLIGHKALKELFNLEEEQINSIVTAQRVRVAQRLTNLFVSVDLLRAPEEDSHERLLREHELIIGFNTEFKDMDTEHVKDYRTPQARFKRMLGNYRTKIPQALRQRTFHALVDPELSEDKLEELKRDHKQNLQSTKPRRTTTIPKPENSTIKQWQLNVLYHHFVSEETDPNSEEAQEIHKIIGDLNHNQIHHLVETIHRAYKLLQIDPAHHDQRCAIYNEFFIEGKSLKKIAEERGLQYSSLLTQINNNARVFMTALRSKTANEPKEVLLEWMRQYTPQPGEVIPDYIVQDPRNEARKQRLGIPEISHLSREEQEKIIIREFSYVATGSTQQEPMYHIDAILNPERRKLPAGNITDAVIKSIRLTITNILHGENAEELTESAEYKLLMKLSGFATNQPRALREFITELEDELDGTHPRNVALRAVWLVVKTLNPNVLPVRLNRK